jgi:hypothetical protein
MSTEVTENLKIVLTKDGQLIMYYREDQEVQNHV